MSDAPTTSELLGADAPGDRGRWGAAVDGTGAPVNPVVTR
jgi:hypothetical protein